MGAAGGGQRKGTASGSGWRRAEAVGGHPAQQRTSPISRRGRLPETAHFSGILPPRCFRGIISAKCAVRGRRMAGYAGSAGAHLGYFARRRRTSRILCREFAGVAGYRGSAPTRGRHARRSRRKNGEVRCPGAPRPATSTGYRGSALTRGTPRQAALAG